MMLFFMLVHYKEWNSTNNHCSQGCANVKSYWSQSILLKNHYHWVHFRCITCPHSNKSLPHFSPVSKIFFWIIKTIQHGKLMSHVYTYIYTHIQCRIMPQEGYYVRRQHYIQVLSQIAKQDKTLITFTCCQLFENVYSWNHYNT